MPTSPHFLLAAAPLVSLLSLPLLACQPDGGDLCARAIELVAECTGIAPADATCEADDDSYLRIISAIEADGCGAIAGGKGDGFVCDLLDVFGWCDEAPPPLFGDPSGQPTRHPIILAHGFNTSTTNFWRFNDVDRALAGDGHQVALGSVPPFDTPAVRASHLSDQLDAVLAETGADKVNLVCFSMGGLDCRYLASPGGLDRGDRIASITTISAPHRGSAIADAVAGLLPDADRAKLIDAVASLWGRTFSELAADSHFVAAMESLAEANMIGFNEVIGDAPGVVYQSWAGYSHLFRWSLPAINAAVEASCRDESGQRVLHRHEGTRDPMDPLLWASAAFVGHFNPLRPGSTLPNDGVSTIESSKWGRFRGCIPADHLDQVGQIKDDGLDRDTGFDYLGFYRTIAFDLAAQGL